MDLTDLDIKDMPTAARQLIDNQIWKANDFIKNDTAGNAEHEYKVGLVENHLKVLEWIREKICKEIPQKGNAKISKAWNEYYVTCSACNGILQIFQPEEQIESGIFRVTKKYCNQCGQATIQDYKAAEFI